MQPSLLLPKFKEIHKGFEKQYDGVAEWIPLSRHYIPLLFHGLPCRGWIASAKPVPNSGDGGELIIVAGAPPGICRGTRDVGYLPLRDDCVHRLSGNARTRTRLKGEPLSDHAGR